MHFNSVTMKLMLPDLQNIFYIKKIWFGEIVFIFFPNNVQTREMYKDVALTLFPLSKYHWIDITED